MNNSVYIFYVKDITWRCNRCGTQTTFTDYGTNAGCFNGGTHVCSNDITCGKTTSTVESYSCSSGYTRNGSKCYNYSCPNGGTLNNTTHICEF